MYYLIFKNSFYNFTLIICEFFSLLITLSKLIMHKPYIIYVIILYEFKIRIYFLRRCDKNQLEG